MDKLKILVVDDSQVALNEAEKGLKDDKTEVITSLSAETAIALIEKDSFDFLLFDYNMPGINGFELIRKVKDSNIVGDAKIFMCTAENKSEAKAEGKQFGVYGWIVKPIDFSKVKSFLVKLAEKN